MIPFFIIFAPVVLVFFASLFFLYQAAPVSKKDHVVVAHVLIFVVLMVLFALFIKRTLYDDIVRMTNEMIASQKQGISFFWQIPTYRISPLSGVLLYVVGQTHWYALMQGIAAAVYYGSLCCIVWTIYRYLSVSRSTVFMVAVILVAFSNFPAIIFGIRSWMALSLCVAAVVYYQLAHRRFVLCEVVAIIGCLVHFQAWSIIVIYVLTVYCGKLIRNATYAVGALYGWGVVPLTNMLASLFPSSSFFHDLQDKASYYFIGGARFGINVSLPQLMFYYSLIVVVAVLLAYCWKFMPSKTKEKLSFPSSYRYLICGYFCACIGSIPGGTPITRFAPTLFLLAIPAFAVVLNRSRVLNPGREPSHTVIGTYMDQIIFPATVLLITVYCFSLAWTTQSLFL